MKKIIFTLVLTLITLSVYSQDQNINGKLTIKNDVILKSENEKTVYNQERQKLYLGSTLSEAGSTSGENSDYIYMTRYNWEYNKSDLRVVIGDDNIGEDRLVIGSKPAGNWQENMVVLNNGKVGINGVKYPKNELEVNGVIRAKEVKIEATGWPDFVFKSDYNLKPLSEVEQHINTHGHLPNIPSETEVTENGIEVGKMQIKLLQKIEELTLYVIAQEKKYHELKEENTSIRKELINLKNK